MLSVARIDIPVDGLNISEAPETIGEQQAVSLTNLRFVGSGLESIRPDKSHTGLPFWRTGAEKITDDVIVFRPKAGPLKYLFAHGGRVYEVDALDGMPVDIGYRGTVGARIRLLQFQNYVMIFNGVDPNKKYDGTNLWNFGIDRPTVAPTLGGPVGNLTRTYYYTYLNSVDGTESNGSPGTTTSAATAGNVNVTVTASSDPQVTKIRIYRTGSGILEPRLCKEVPNVTGTYNDSSSEVDVASAPKMPTDHDKPNIFRDAVIHNNRLFAWGGKNADGTENMDTLWISNEYQPQYMPIIPFLDSEEAVSGGPIDITPGDGGKIMAFAPWGGGGIVFKEGAVYRVQETEVGFYAYQTMPIPPCIARNSVKLVADGLIWLSQDGWMLLDSNESVTNFGVQIRDIIDHIDNFDLVSSGVSRGYYITSFRLDNGEWYSLTFTRGAWQGKHSQVVGSSYFTDIDGTLYIGRVMPTPGINEARIHEVWKQDGIQTHDPVGIVWIDKARQYAPGRYSKIWKIVVVGRTLTKDGIKQPLILKIYDENQSLLTSTDFDLPVSEGSVEVWFDATAFGRYLSVAIEGTIVRPIRIVGMEVYTEGVGGIR